MSIPCFHCGLPCPDGTIAIRDKVFCCQGCLAVHEILSASGLERFYDLNAHPGIRVQKAATKEQWAFLDEPAVQQRLLDFHDGELSRITLHIPAIHCVACIWLLENLFRLNRAVGASRANFPRREVKIDFDPRNLSLSGLVTLLASIGYEPKLTLNELDKVPASPVRRRQWLQVGVAGFAFGNIMLFSIPGYLGLDSISGPRFQTLFGFASLLLALPVFLYSASDYWRSALLSWRQRTLTLDVPIVLGLTALYCWSAFEIISGRGEGYLDSLAGLVFLLLCGRAFQQKTFDRIAFDLDYRCFFPLSVTRKTQSGEETVALSSLATGDRLLLRHGELIPADACLIRGDACIDYSFVTGESEPVNKVQGEYLYAGGKQAGGLIEVEMVKPVSQSYLASLWSHEAFQKGRSEQLQTLTNIYSRRFTWIVLTIALGAVCFWVVNGQPGRGLKAFASVLIVACPCALALAAPFTHGTAQRLLARAKILLKSGLVLERLAQVNTIVFDKTGTLTSPAASSVSYTSANGALTEPELQAVRAVAGQSTHTHAQSISRSLAFTETRTLSVRGFSETAGAGIIGRAGTHEVRVGSRAWLADSGVSSSWRAPGPGSTSFLAVDGRIRGAFVLTNALRPEVEQLLVELGRDFELALLSGDNDRERERLRKLFTPGARLSFHQSPIEKLEFIHERQKARRTVMMVGDGLNDAGALKQSDVGVAVVETASAFSPASDVILHADALPRLSNLLRFARHCTSIVRLSFTVSAAYNLIGISVAASGFLSPLICAVLMPISSITVMLFATGATSWAARRAALAPTP